MSPRTAGTMKDTFTLMHNLSEARDGKTVGELVKMMPWVTKGQMIRMLETLEDLFFTYRENVKHGRTGKNVWRMTDHCAIHMAAIARNYTERN